MTDLLLPSRFTRREDLYASGLTPGALRGQVRRGELHRVFPNVYSQVPLDKLDISERCDAAQVYSGARLRFSCHTALALDGGPERAGPLHSTNIDGVRTRSTSGLIVHQFAGAASATAVRRGHLVLPREIAAVQAFGCLPARERGAYLLGLVQQGLVRPVDVFDHVGACTAGRAELLELLRLAADGTHSMGELRMLASALRNAGLPDPERQHRVSLPGGGVAYLDGAYVKAKVGLEYDGREYHFTTEARLRDIARDAELAALGWLILHCTAEQLRGAAARRFAEQVRRAVISRGGF